jgi:hypothetical protein
MKQFGKKVLTLPELLEKAPGFLRESFLESTKHSREVISGLSERWGTYGLGVIDTFNISDYDEYCSAQSNIFFHAAELARDIGDYNTQFHFNLKRQSADYSPDYYRRVLDEPELVISAIIINPRTRQTKLILDIVKPSDL